MAKLSISILFGERVAATHVIDVEDKTFLGVERSDMEVAMKEMAAKLGKLGKDRRENAARNR